MFGKKPTKKLLFQAPTLDGDRETCKKDYTFETKLGDGAFGQVWKIKHKKTGKIYACKQVAKERVLKMIEQFRREVLIMYELSHPNIIKLYHHFEDDKYFYLVMEIAEGGNLFQKLASEKTFLEKQANQYFRDVLGAVEYLHSHIPAIIHRDIKPENILINSKGVLKLTDFGWSNYYSVEQGTPRYTICGTFEYLCPEMVKESGHTPAVDIWCLGILLYEMLCGYTPFKAPSKENLMENISKGKIKYPNTMSALAKNLISKIVEKNPIKRFTIEKIKQHEWLKSFLSESPSKLIQKPEKDKLKVPVELNNSITDANKYMHLNSFRKSLNNLKGELCTNIEFTKDLKEKIRAVGIRVKNEEVNSKMVELEILERKKALLEFEENHRVLSEKLSDSNIILEKLGGLTSFDILKSKIEDSRADLQAKQNDLSLKQLQITELNSLLSSSEANLTDKTRYLQNLKQYSKKMKAKGSVLHKTRQSQISDLLTSYEFFKTKITEHEKQLEKIETPENKVARELMFYVKENKDKIIDCFTIEEKLRIVEENLSLKEFDLERIKIEFLDNKKNYIKNIRLEKDKILNRNIEKEETREKLKSAMSSKSLLEEELEKSRALEKRYRLESIDINTAREKIKALRIKINTINTRINKVKGDRGKIKSSIDKRAKNIEDIEMELGIVKSTILRIENAN